MEFDSLKLSIDKKVATIAPLENAKYKLGIINNKKSKYFFLSLNK